MEKRYQFFISSTFSDLKEERKAVYQAILEMDHFPAGMELFPACDEKSWDIIKKVIEQSDYYLLIIGGRYGSLDEIGLSFTEKEYEYAKSRNVPIIPLLHENPGVIPRDKTDTDEKWKKLQLFRAKMERNHTCKYWNSIDDISSKAIASIFKMIKDHPATGWIRSNDEPNDETVRKLLMFQQKVSDLEEQLESNRVLPPEGSEHLRQGSDVLSVSCTFTAIKQNKSVEYSGGRIGVSWDEIFFSVAPSMIDHCGHVVFISNLNSLFEKKAREQLENFEEVKDSDLGAFKFSQETYNICIVQLRALGLITENIKDRKIKDGTYWSLTPFGDRYLTQKMALKKKKKSTASTKRKG